MTVYQINHNHKNLIEIICNPTDVLKYIDRYQAILKNGKTVYLDKDVANNVLSKLKTLNNIIF